MEFSKKDIDAISTIRSATSQNIDGLHRGRVESIDDPDRLGRAKIRVFAIHGDDQRTPTRSLPWADIAEPGGGGYDYGSFNPPPVGSTVWVGFEAGHVDFPVVLGTFRGVPKRDEDNPNVMLVKDNEPLTEKAWLPPDDESETPKDIFEDVYRGDPHPTRRIWGKSYKGHTFLVEDADGKEFLKIIDRAGQIISMECPVDSTYSEGNQAQRGVRDSMRGDQLPHEIMKNRRAFVRIKDLSGQEIALNSIDQNESISITSKSRDGQSVNSIELKSGQGKESIEIVDSAGDKILMDPNSITPIVIKDSSGNQIIFDKDNGKVKLVSTKSSEEETPRKDITVNGELNESIKGDKVSSVLGNKKSQVVQDLNLGVLGNTNVSLGGSIQAVITGQNMDGSFPDSAIDVKVNQVGGTNISVNNVNGDIEIDTTSGDIQLGTVAGNARLYSSLGNALVEAQNEAVLDGLTSHLGPSTTAVHPIIRGDLHNSAMISYLTTTMTPAISTILGTLSGIVSSYSSPTPAITTTHLVPILTAIIGLLTTWQGAVSSLAGSLPGTLSNQRKVD